MKKPSDFRVVYHGIEHEQYFQGHGVAFSKFTDCATGIGDSVIEALNDALEVLAQNGWDVSVIETELANEIASFETMRVAQEEEILRLIHDGCNDTSKCEHEADIHYYVSVDVCE